MRTTSLLALALCSLTACSPASEEDAEAFCADLATQNDGCWNDGLDQDCLDSYAECGENIMVMESCPVQLGC